MTQIPEVAADLKQLLIEFGTGQKKATSLMAFNPLVRRAINADCLIWHEQSGQYALTALGQAVAFKK